MSKIMNGENCVDEFPTGCGKSLDHLLAHIVEDAGEAIVSSSLDDCVTFWNQAAERLLGYDAADIQGKRIYRVIPPRYRLKEAAMRREVKEGARAICYESVRITPEGENCCVSVSLSPIKDASGTVIGLSEIIRDRSEAAHSGPADHGDQDRFLANLSHELRNPINAVLGWAQLLVRGSLSPDRTREAIQVIERNAKAQAAIIETLLGRRVSGVVSLPGESAALGASKRLEDSPRPGSDLSAYSILLIEDNQDTRELMKRVLTSTGAQVLEAASAEEAYPCLRCFHVDIIVSDLGLPGEDGFSFIKKVRDGSCDIDPGIPALAVSAWTGDDEKTRALGCGFSAHLGKPFELEDIIEAVSELLATGMPSTQLGA